MNKDAAQVDWENGVLKNEELRERITELEAKLVAQEEIAKKLWDEVNAQKEVLRNRAVVAETKLEKALRDIEDLTFCEECEDICEKMSEPKAYPPRYCHTCQQKLVKRIINAERERDEARARPARDGE